MPYNQQYYQMHKEQWVKYREDFSKKYPSYYAEYRQNHREEIKAWNRNHSKYYNDYQRSYKKNNPKIVNAQNVAEQNCSLAQYCELCGSTENLERHHPDYAEPKIIVTVCVSCHRWTHKG